MTGIFKRMVAALAGLASFGIAAMAHPGSGIAVDTHGRVFFTAGPTIVMIDTNGVARTIVNDRKHEKFYQLHHLQRSPGGGFLTASDMGNAIWQFTTDGALTRYYPPPNDARPLAVGSGGDPFAVGPDGTVYAVNSRQDRFTQILAITAEGRVNLLAGGDWGFADGRGSAAQFGELHGGSMLALPNRNLLVTDHSVRVRRIAADGTVTTLAGGRERGFADGPGLAARFDGARGLALDTEGGVLVVEQSGRIRRISPAGAVTTAAGSGIRGRRDGLLPDATFDEPTGIAVAPNGDWFVLEPGGPRVRRISAGRVSTIHAGLP